MERDTFSDMSEKEMRELRRQAPWLKPGYMTEQQINELVGKISEKKGRSIQLTTYASDVELDSLTKTLNPLVLYEEVKARSLERTTKSHLIHQVEKKSNSAEHHRLFQWNTFNETIQPFLSTVEYHVRQKKRQTVIHASNSLVLSNKDLRVVVQDKLIESHFNDSSFTAPELVEAIERILDASLIKVVIFRDVALYFFEWIDAMPFVLVMAFQMKLVDYKDQSLVQHTVVTLHRRDVMDFPDEEDEKQREKELAKQKAKKEKRENTTPNNQSLLKALIDGMQASESDDELEMDVEEPIIATKVKYLNSMNLETEMQLKSFINNVRGTYISYITVAYVKRY